MPTRYFLILALVFTLAGTARAEPSLRGKIIEAGTGEPIPSAPITLEGEHPEFRKETNSTDQGSFYFSLLPPGRYRLRVEAEKYFPQDYPFNLKPRQHLQLTVELTPDVPQAQRIQVFAEAAAVDPDQTSSSRLITSKDIENLPAHNRSSVPALVAAVMPGAVLGHDNFVHLRGNELSLHQFINGVSFLDNAHEHFTPGLSPQVFESANILSGGFPAEFGNRFGGILDLTTRSGHSLGGHGSLAVGLGTQLQNDAGLQYGGGTGRFGYYFFAGGHESNRFLNPPTPREHHDFGWGMRQVAQLDYQTENDLVKLFLSAGGTRFELPNTDAEQLLGRDASRRVRSQTAILSWQHFFTERTALASSFYERDVSDRLLPTTDTVTLMGEGSRSTLTNGLKLDLIHLRDRHNLKFGVDGALYRLKESFAFDPRSFESELPAFSFRGRNLGGQVSGYLQDRFSPLSGWTVDVGLRWDQFSMDTAAHAVSPRLGLAYHSPNTGTVIHFSYNRLFVPPPLEYVQLASYLGGFVETDHHAEGMEMDPAEDMETDHHVEGMEMDYAEDMEANHHAEGITPPGNVKPFTQNYYEVGFSQRLHPKLTLEVTAYRHTGRNGFETGEIGNTRLFLPVNFRRSRASGAELALHLRHLERLGLEARFQYAAARIHFFGPVSGGFGHGHPGFDEPILPAFDQTHTGTARIFYRRPWRDAWAGFIFGYGSGTPVEQEDPLTEEHARVRLPQHLTVDFSSGLTAFEHERHRLALEFNLVNLSNNIYQIAKESEFTPIQFSPRRTVIGSLTWHF